MADQPEIVNFLRQGPGGLPPALFPHQNVGPDLVLKLNFSLPLSILRVPAFIQLKSGSVSKIGGSVFAKLQPSHFYCENRATSVASSSSASARSRRTKGLSVSNQYAAVHHSLQETLADTYGRRYLSLLISTPALKKSAASKNYLCWCVDQDCFLPAEQAQEPSQPGGKIDVC